MTALKDFLQKAPFPKLLVVAGLAFTGLGLLNEVDVATVHFDVVDGWGRVAAGVVGIALLSVGVFLWVTTSKQPGVESQPLSLDLDGPSASDPVAENLLYTLDDRSDAGFRNVSEGATRISILGRTAVNLLGQYCDHLVDLINGGCEVRLLIVDPRGKAKEFVYGQNQQLYDQNVAITNSQISAIQMRTNNGLMVRSMDAVPSFGMIIVEKANQDSSSLRVQLYFLNSPVGRDRPIVPIGYGDRWFAVFKREFSKLWETAEAFSIAGADANP